MRSARSLQEGSETRFGDLAAEPFDVVGVLEHAAERLCYELRVEMVRMQRGQRVRPVERLSHAGYLGQPKLAQRGHEARDLLAEAGVEPRHLPGHDPHLLLEARV